MKRMLILAILVVILTSSVCSAGPRNYRLQRHRVTTKQVDQGFLSSLADIIARLAKLFAVRSYEISERQ